MKSSSVRIPLRASNEQHARLLALQKAFSEVCNALAPIVQQNRCWHRVTLHHLAYRTLRTRFPAIGSQMVCNAIYSVCRTARIVFQHPQSPAHVSRYAEKPLPLMQFSENSPVYFDRHTLSVKDGQLSMFTLDGRMHFQLALQPADEARFHNEKLHEVVLSRVQGGHFELSFWFTGVPEEARAGSAPPNSLRGAFPEYVKVEASHEIR
jgi:hypothetical protein